MYRQLQSRLVTRLGELLRSKYGVELDSIGVDSPPSVAMGEYALTFCFELAKRLKKSPRKIAEEIVAEIGAVPGFSKFEVAGGGYINARLDRAAAAREILNASAPGARTNENEDKRPPQEKILVEHTSINPNKAAHIGHLRNAILGDTFVRMLRFGGCRVDVQNYIDNTGVQVADVVVAFAQFESIHTAVAMKTRIAEIEVTGTRFDFYCWDLYARISQWYEQSAENKAARLHTLHEIEQGGNAASAIAGQISDAVLRRHLETMQRLAIEYDFLPRESEILSLHFWDLAFALLKDKGVLYFENDGKNKGCWVMKRAGSAPAEAAAGEGGVAGPDEDAKVIVRSNGTVTYVGKDIAYHLWKFGLLGRDFGYRRFYRYPNGHQVWISAEQDDPGAPHFGGVSAIYNVIDSRQADPQNNVIEALRAMGYSAQAGHYTHFSYEMVALTPRCAIELGYHVSEADRLRAYIEVSGRKGFGVKADDLLDALIASAEKDVVSRHPDRSEADRTVIATQIAIGALRYFMLKFTKNSVIAFDFRDALSFEGETGPYCQYAAVRAANIFRKAGTSAEAVLAKDRVAAQWLAEDDIWELWLTASKLRQMIEQAIATTEPAYVAKYAFQLAQSFNNFYHHHHILNESDAARRDFLLATAAVARRELLRALEVMAIEAPEVM